MRENRIRRTPQVSDARFVRVGLVGPKAQQHGEADGQRVNNPVPQRGSQSGTQRRRPAHEWSSGCASEPSGGSGWACLPRKAELVTKSLCPYRKPTRVGRSSRPRRTGELWLRNSATCTRNFGRSVNGETRWHRRGPTDCLPKTQVSAKAQADV